MNYFSFCKAFLKNTQNGRPKWAPKKQRHRLMNTFTPAAAGGTSHYLLSLHWTCFCPPPLQDDSTGEMIFDEVFHALKLCLSGLAQPFKVPGTDRLFKPKIFITILVYSSIIGLTSHQVITVIYFSPENETKPKFLSD